MNGSSSRWRGWLVAGAIFNYKCSQQPAALNCILWDSAAKEIDAWRAGGAQMTDK